MGPFGAIRTMNGLIGVTQSQANPRRPSGVGAASSIDSIAFYSQFSNWNAR
jgi:hypothetical protein